MWQILKNAGIDPAPRRSELGWPQFLRPQAEAILACDFFTADLLDGTRAYILAVVDHATRRLRILGVAQYPTGVWTAQQARNLIMDLSDQVHRVKFMPRDRGSNFTAAFDAVLADAGIRAMLCNVRTPRMNAIAERWIGGCRRELLDRGLIAQKTVLSWALSQLRAQISTHSDGNFGLEPDWSCCRSTSRQAVPLLQPTWPARRAKGREILASSWLRGERRALLNRDTVRLPAYLPRSPGLCPDRRMLEGVVAGLVDRELPVGHALQKGRPLRARERQHRAEWMP